MDKQYRICTRCIMDTSDPNISFDSKGVCNHCKTYDKRVALEGYKGKRTDKALKDLVARIKSENVNREYDCILGISGGVDSAYMAYIAKQLGLRVLAVHVDAGWNSEVAVQNIQKMCKALDMDLHTVVIDWTAMKELQRAYMFSGVANLDVPQDHVFLAAMYQYADKYNVKYMLNGSNFATEGILPRAWGYAATDFKCIKNIYKACGRGKRIFSKYPHFGLLKYAFYQRKIRRINLLNYVPYSKSGAIETLSKEFDWKYYGGKHFESRFTKFFQSYYLPKKFGYDKKRAHLSSMVVGGELSREQALIEMADTSAYTEKQMLEDRDYIMKKLDISEKEWESIMSAPCKKEAEYGTNEKLLRFLIDVKHKNKIKKADKRELS